MWPVFLLSGKPTNSVRAYAVRARQVNAVRALPVIWIENINWELFLCASGIHNWNARGEPAKLVFTVKRMLLKGIPFVACPWFSVVHLLVNAKHLLACKAVYLSSTWPYPRNTAIFDKLHGVFVEFFKLIEMAGIHSITKNHKKIRLRIVDNLFYQWLRP